MGQPTTTHEQETSGEERSTSLEVSEEDTESDNDAKSNEESEDGEWQSGDERVHDDSDESEGSVHSAPPSPTAPARESPVDRNRRLRGPNTT